MHKKFCAYAKKGENMPWGWGWGRGWRWGFWLTGMPGWMRWTYFSYNYPVTAYPWFWRCRWFPWLPRWWWTGMYGPVVWTPQGPFLQSQLTFQPQQSFQPFFQPSPQDELSYLENELKMLEEERKAIEKEIESIKKRIEELKQKTSFNI